jgi:hypothetical protein
MRTWSDFLLPKFQNLYVNWPILVSIVSAKDRPIEGQCDLSIKIQATIYPCANANDIGVMRSKKAEFYALADNRR